MSLKLATGGRKNNGASHPDEMIPNALDVVFVGQTDDAANEGGVGIEASLNVIWRACWKTRWSDVELVDAKRLGVGTLDIDRSGEDDVAIWEY